MSIKTIHQTSDGRQFSLLRNALRVQRALDAEVHAASAQRLEAAGDLARALVSLAQTPVAALPAACN